MTTDRLSKLYSTGFYQTNVKSSTPSSRALLGRLFELWRPESVVDFGCGSGAWLAGAESLGVSTLVGFDGPWVDPRELTSTAIDFRPINMAEEDVVLDRTYDMAISVEVAEHLPEARANYFVDLIAGSASVVVFGAAVPGQGGTHHVNEQPQSYWIRKFADRGYECFDIFRGAFWDDQDIKWWFRQNTFLFVHKDFDGLDRNELRALVVPVIDAVHPDNFASKLRGRREDREKLSEEIKSLKSALESARAGSPSEPVSRRLDDLERKVSDLQRRASSADSVKKAIKGSIYEPAKRAAASVRRQRN